MEPEESSSILKIIDAMRKWKRMDFSLVFREKLSMPEFTILNGIERIGAKNDVVYVSDVAHLFSMSAQAVSKYLKMCESRDLVIRETDKKDRRNTKLFLTDEGRRVLSACENDLTSFLSSVLDEFDKSEIDRMIVLADEIYERTAKKLEQLYN